MGQQQRMDESSLRAAPSSRLTEVAGCCPKGCQEVRSCFAFGFFEQLNNGGGRFKVACE